MKDKTDYSVLNKAPNNSRNGSKFINTINTINELGDSLGGVAKAVLGAGAVIIGMITSFSGNNKGSKYGNR